MKHKRVVDKKLLDAVKKKPCLACGVLPSDPDHVTTRGAGGGDTESNVWPLCRTHHVERHKSGLGYMVKNYFNCRAWLELYQRFDVLQRIQK